MSQLIENRTETSFDQDLLLELVYFENFFQWAGFKRIEGAIFGLLTLSEHPLTSEEIESILNLSQSATSISLKNLNSYGIIHTFDNRERKVKVHSAKDDTLQIVATILRKREQQSVEEFRQMAQRIINNKKQSWKDAQSSAPYRRLESIIATCNMAESMMKLVIELSQHASAKAVAQLSKYLPQMVELLNNKTELITDLVKEGLSKLTGGKSNKEH